MSTEPFNVGRFVAGKINHLLGSQSGNLSPTSRAMLAQLRQAANAQPGTVPSVWALTAEGLPSDGPEAVRARMETAVHVALTQFATHQQAKSTSMHNPQQRFGTAVRRFAERGGSDHDPHETPIYSRFSAMTTSTTLAGLLAHSRGIITQLRGEDIAFDYGSYANDIFWFLTPGQSNEVRRRWGRDFHRHTSPTDQDTLNAEGAHE